MKRAFALLLALILLLLPGCRTAPGEESGSSPNSPDSAPLRVLIDAEFGNMSSISVQKLLNEYEELTVPGGQKKYKSFQDVIADLGGPEDIELELPPSHGERRDAYLTSLRTELMSGGGPDLMVCVSGQGWYWDDTNATGQFEDALFRFPQQAMERNMFLPLDSYIENAQFMEWDKLTPAIMEAGKNEHGQLLLPMTYTVPVTYYKKADLSPDFDPGLSWKDMLSGPPELACAAASSHLSLQSTALAPIADYEHDTLAITEEELLEYVTQRLEARERLKSLDLPDRSSQSLKPNISFDTNYGRDNELALVPVYSRSGGYTALIKSFLGINVNSKRPDDAFFVADYLMSMDAQRSKLYVPLTWDSALPTMEGLMDGRGASLSTGADEYVYMSDNLYPAFAALRDGLSSAAFYTPLDLELYNLELELEEGTDKPIKDLVHAMYMRMKMMLAES